MKFYIMIALLFPLYCLAQEQQQESKKKLEKDTVIQLNTVNIAGKKNLIKRKADRLEFNIDKTPLQNLNGWEILKNTPNVMVKNDVLTVRGSAQIVVTINDKKTLMSAEQLKQYLETLEGSNINAVEVITNPPAKYEAEGGAVINIKTKQNTLLGYKSRVGLRYHQGIYAKEQLSTQQSFNTAAWQLTGNYSFVSGDYVRKNFDVVSYIHNHTRWESDMVRKTEAHQQHRYDFSGQYSIDSLQNLQFGISGNSNPKSVGNYVVPTHIYSTVSNQIQSSYLTKNARFQKYGGLNAYLVYDKKLGEHTFTWSNYFSSKYYDESQDIATELNFINQPKDFNRFGSAGAQKINLYSSQLDYQFKKDQFMLESGVKYSRVHNTNDLSFFDGTAQALTYNALKSNLFNYYEGIFAGYVSSQYHWDKWELKAGIRSETTSIKTSSNNPVIEDNKTSTSIFPTVYLMYSLKEGENLGFSYGKRIGRPNYDFLNPSKSYYNLYAYFQGDANLKPTIMHNWNLTYTLNSWNFEMYYTYKKNPSMEISVQNPATFETVYHYTNIDWGRNIGADVSKNFSLTKRWTLNLFAMGDYNEDYFMGVDNQLHKNKVFFYNVNLSSQITLDRAKTWDLNLGYNYNSKSIQGSFNISASQNFNIILNKKMLNGRLEAGLVVNDIFKTDNSIVSTDYADQKQYFTDYRDTRYFILNLKYNFGNQKIKDAKALRQTDEQKRM